MPLGIDGGIDALATKQSPGLFLPNANAFGASCLLHCVQFTHRTLQIFNLSASPVRGAFLFVKAVGFTLVFLHLSYFVKKFGQRVEFGYWKTVCRCYNEGRKEVAL